MLKGKRIDYKYDFRDIFHSSDSIKMATGKWRSIYFRQDVRKIDFFQFLLIKQVTLSNYYKFRGGGVAQWLGRRISDQGVPGSIPGRCTFRCGLEQVTFTLLSTG